MVEKELWFYRDGENDGNGNPDRIELSSLIDRGKWRRKKKSAEQTGKSMALNLIRTQALRNVFHRTPCMPDDKRFKNFEERFGFTPTPDQVSCFEVCKK